MKKDMIILRVDTSRFGSDYKTVMLIRFIWGTKIWWKRHVDARAKDQEYDHKPNYIIGTPDGLTI